MTRSPDTYRFAVFFDTHYCVDRDVSMPVGCAEIDDTPRYVWMRTHLFPKLIAELQDHAPEICISTGDISEGNSDDASLLRRELQEVFERLSEAKLPILNAKGTHEPDQFYSEIALPVFSSTLGRDITENYFAFDSRAGRFVLLDYSELAPGTEQADWLHEQCESTPADKALFIFAHAPVVNFARPFFSHEPMRQVLQEVFLKRTPTVFFCGHTHNQALTYHRTAQGAFVQIKGSTVGFPDIPVEPLDDRHVLLLGEEDTYYWGVPEDQCPGYWIVDVTPEGIHADWYGIGHGLLGRVQLFVSGQEPVVVKRPALLVNRLRVADLPLVQSACLELFMSGDAKGDFECYLNDEPLGRMAPNICFAARRFLPLTKEATASLDAGNELKVKVGTASSWLLGSARIVAHTYDGRRLVSSIPDRIVASGEYAERAAGQRNFRVVGVEDTIAIEVRIDV